MYSMSMHLLQWWLTAVVLLGHAHSRGIGYKRHMESLVKHVLGVVVGFILGYSLGIQLGPLKLWYSTLVMMMNTADIYSSYHHHHQQQWERCLQWKICTWIQHKDWANNNDMKNMIILLTFFTKHGSSSTYFGCVKLGLGQWSLRGLLWLEIPTQQ